MSKGFIPAHGGYKKLLSYQKALIVFDGTVYFCGKYFDRRDRTVDQMVQAARSGKQNIVEGSKVSGVSKESEIKLTGVAKGSLEELLEDYRDFLRKRKVEEWEPGSREVKRLQELNRTAGANYETFRKGIEHDDPGVSANVMIGLIKLTVFLLERQLDALEERFVMEGGLKERMFAARMAERNSPRDRRPFRITE